MAVLCSGTCRRSLFARPRTHPPFPRGLFSGVEHIVNVDLGYQPSARPDHLMQQASTSGFTSRDTRWWTCRTGGCGLASTSRSGPLSDGQGVLRFWPGALPMTVAKVSDAISSGRLPPLLRTGARFPSIVRRRTTDQLPLPLIENEFVLLIVGRCPLIAYALHFRSHLLRHASRRSVPTEET